MARKLVSFLLLCLLLSNVSMAAAPSTLSAEDTKFIDMVQRKAFDFFWDNADPRTGLIKDQTNNFGPDTEKEAHKKYRASIAAVGFGLSAYIVGVERGWITQEQAYNRVKVTLNTFDKVLYRDNRGLYYHWIDMRNNGRWMWDAKDGSEISTIDTALFITGAISVAEYFNTKYNKPEFKKIVDHIYTGIKWNGLGDSIMSYYNEYIILTLLGMGSPENTISPSMWDKMWRSYQYSTATRKNEANYPRVFYPSLFIHIFPQVWFDFRDKHDKYADYFLSSRNSVLANRQYCIDHGIGGIGDKQYQFTTYGENSWGLSASEIPPPRNYDHYGEAEPALDDSPASGMRGLAGNVAIHAAGGSMPFTPEESLSMMKYLYKTYKDDLWGKYGFCDAFNTDQRERKQFNNKSKTMWRAEIVSGLDQGAILLMIENYRTGLIWKYFMMNQFVQKGMERAGFVAKGEPSEGAVIDLSGKWAFKTGDNSGWKQPGFDDSSWKQISVPAYWETQGFDGYDGIAWYRCKFKTTQAIKDSTSRLILIIGAIDDADETYLNGEKIGGLGKFPPEVKSAWGVQRVYEVPKRLLSENENVLAVRVNDTSSGGGIWKGPVTIAVYDAVQFNPLGFVVSREWKDLINLEGLWQFKTGDVKGSVDVIAKSSGWKTINAPGAWETQGFPEYDGIAYYKKEFKLDAKQGEAVKADTLTFKIGPIDDADITYLNGKQIGNDGDFPPGTGTAWDRPRNYEFQKSLLNFGGKNTLLIKVNDNVKDGGIMAGPIKISY